MKPCPPAWGETRCFDVAAELGAEVPDWASLVRPHPDGETLTHGSRGSIHVDTIVLVAGDEAIALADCRHVSLANLYAYDQEYYQYLRLREILDPAAWQATIWRELVPGHVMVAWDKFHGYAYVRGIGDAPMMSFGGDWAAIEAEVASDYLAIALPPGPASDSALLIAVRRDRLEDVVALLARRADPNAGPHVPPGSGLAMGVSVAREASLVWESVHHASPAVTEALLSAGAAVDARPPGGLTALVGAIRNDRLAHVPVLLRHGADPTLVCAGKSAFEWAAPISADLVAMLRAPR